MDFSPNTFRSPRPFPVQNFSEARHFIYFHSVFTVSKATRFKRNEHRITELLQTEQTRSPSDRFCISRVVRLSLQIEVGGVVIITMEDKKTR